MARRRLASQDYDGSRAAVQKAVSFFADCKETAKLNLAEQFKDEIAQAELSSLLSSVDSAVNAARQKLFGDEIEEAREGRGKAYATVQSAQVIVGPLLDSYESRRLAIMSELLQLSEDHAPCAGI